MTSTSGKFLLRLTPALHADLRRHAAACDVSLNELCTRLLATGSLYAGLSINDGIAFAIARARDVHQDDLAAVVIYGSWVRGTATQASDIDALIVLRQGATIRRQMYRAWDEHSLTVEGHSVEPAIVALPEDGARTSGFWAEIATQGLICWCRDLTVQQYLTKVREKIAGGELRRAVSHGQTYWVHRTEVV